MMKILQSLLIILGLSLAGISLGVIIYKSSSSNRDIQAYKNTSQKLGSDLGRPVFIRIVKEQQQLELWVQSKQGWKIKHSYPILAMSGQLGPKTKEGDKQAPEGFYKVTKGLLNPKSRFHLAFNIGYPNAYDQSLNRTGSFIMVHGSKYSIGCFAMGDPAIEEIYTMVATALDKGQASIPVQIYPFEMDAHRMMKESNNAHYPFWQYLQKGWNYTQKHQKPYHMD